MGHWGWRPALTVWVCVWTVGCTMSSRADVPAAPAPSPTAAITLTVRGRATPTPTPSRRLPARVAQRPTPQPSPTPRTYTVQADDTLLGIALALGVSLEDLRATNPAVDPRTLQIGQVLRLPDVSQDPDAPPDVGALPALDLRPPICEDTPTNAIVCLGLVGNPLDVPVEQVRVELTLYDGQGALIAAQEADIEQGVLPPGGVAPYQVRFLGAAAWPLAEVEVALRAADLTDQASTGLLVPLALEEVTTTTTARTYAVRATLVNLTNAPVAAPRAVLTVLDATGQVVGYRVWQATTPLAAGGRAPVLLSVVPLGGPHIGLRHTLHVEARPAAPETR